MNIDDGFRHTSSDLKQLQALPLDAKIAATKHRIKQWIDKYGVDGCYISFSGGKDSTVLLYIVREMIGYTQEQIPAVFSNTGLEFSEIQKFAKAHGATFITPKMRFNEVISTYGYPLISKEVSEAIYYARRIKNSNHDYGKTPPPASAENSSGGVFSSATAETQTTSSWQSNDATAQPWADWRRRCL